MLVNDPGKTVAVVGRAMVAPCAKTVSLAGTALSPAKSRWGLKGVHVL